MATFDMVGPPASSPAEVPHETVHRLELLKQLIRTYAICADRASPDAVPPYGPGEWFLDLRAVTLIPEALDIVSSEFWKIYRSRGPIQVAGLELGAVPLVGAILQKARELGISSNGLIVRKSRNKSGLTKRVEGRPNADPVVVVDDILHSGLSVDSVCLALGELTLDVASCFALVDYRSPAGMAWRKDLDMDVRSLLSLSDFALPLANTDRLSDRPVGGFQELWSYRHPEPSDLGSVTARSSPVVWRDCVFFGTSSGDFVCLSVTDGSLRWQRPNDAPSFKGIRSNPEIFDGKVFFGGYDGNVYALDASTGAAAWIASCAEYVGSSPVISAELGLLFIGLEREVPGRRGALAALDVATGQILWEVETENYLHATPVLCGERGLVVVGTNDNRVLCVDAKDGSIRWSHVIGGLVKAAPALCMARDVVCVGATDGGFYGMSLEDGSRKFVQWAESSIETTPLIVAGRAFYTATDKCFYVVDLETGVCVARLRSRGRSFSSPALINDGVVFGNNAGLLFDIDPRTLNLRGRHQMVDRITSKTAYDSLSDQYFVHTFEDRLVALRRVRALGDGP